MLKEFLNLLFPTICFACGKGMSVEMNNICIACRNELPRTKFHLQVNNPVSKLFWGRLEIEKATAYLKFEQGNKTQKLLHQLKYKGQKQVGVSLGEMAAVELGQAHFFEDIDLLIPIPIHPKKERIRGYNQSQYIAAGISNLRSIPFDISSVRKNINTSTQTRKSRYKRYENVIESFEILNVEKLEGKHLLLVDDVITTGATLEACGALLKSIPNVRLSVLTIAFTY